MRFTDWPEIPVPQAAVDMGMVPNDWKNDASAAMSFPDEIENEDRITLWVGDDDTKDEVGAKYQVDIGTMEDSVLYFGDSLRDALIAVRKERKRRLLAKKMKHHRPNPEPGIEYYDRRWLKAGVSYQYVTPESAEQGTYEDAGWEVESHPVTFREATDLIRQYAPYDSVSDRFETGRSLIFYGADEEIDYRDGGSTRRDVIITGDKESMSRIIKWWRTKGRGR